MKSIIIYTSSTCGFCKALKAFLNARRISFEEKDIITHSENFSEMQKYAPAVMSVPVIVFNRDQTDQEVQVGFDEALLIKTLGLS